MITLNSSAEFNSVYIALNPIHIDPPKTRFLNLTSSVDGMILDGAADVGEWEGPDLHSIRSEITKVLRRCYYYHPFLCSFG